MSHRADPDSPFPPPGQADLSSSGSVTFFFLAEDGAFLFPRPPPGNDPPPSLGGIHNPFSSPFAGTSFSLRTLRTAL